MLKGCGIVLHSNYFHNFDTSNFDTRFLSPNFLFTKIFLILLNVEVKSIRARLSVIYMVFQVNLYSGALFIQQALQWNLYLSVFALLALTCICTIGKYSFSHPEKTS